MSDLVKRGREYSEQYDHTEITSELCDEIERLTALLDYLGYCPEHGRVMPCEACGFEESK